MNILFYLAAFMLAIGVLIVVHEFGHYGMARLFKVKVVRFAVGFGRIVYTKQFKPGGTEWAVGIFPLGGYVKMVDEREGPVAPEDLPHAFNRQSVGKRFLIVLAGPLANFLLAIALYWLMFLHGVPGAKPIVGDIPAQTAAARAGLQNGDLLRAIDGEPVETWQDARWLLLQKAVAREAVLLEVTHTNATTAQLKLDLSDVGPEDLDSDFIRKLGLSPYQPPFDPIIGKLTAGGVAANSGFYSGDRVLDVNGTRVNTWEDFVKIVRGHPGQNLVVGLERGGDTRRINLTPAAASENGTTVGKIGAAPQVDPSMFERFIVTVHYGPIKALGAAVQKCWETSVFSLKMLGKMILGQVSWRNISGPITIADYAGQSAQLGWLPYLIFLASISISLGVLNLLPVPLLDGGHLMYYIVEFVKGSPVSDRAMAIGQQIGIAVLLTLMAFAFYNDINRLITPG